MRELASWTPRRVMCACVLWIIGAPVLAALGLVLGALMLAAFSGRHSIGVSIKMTDWTAGWLFVPPIILVGAWIWSRARSTQSHTGT